MPATLEPLTAPRRNSASFRDPCGFVFDLDGRVLRAVDVSCHDIFTDLVRSGLFAELVGAGLVIDTKPVDDPAVLERLRAAYPGWKHFLEHKRIAHISYPYEWSPAMLADAGILTLDLQIRLLERGYSLKDATAYNIQFVNGRPVFIDIPSIERPPRLDVWIGLGQFSRMFTYPLLLNREKGQSLRSYFLAHLGGAPVEEVRRAFGRLEVFRPSLLWDVALPCWLSRRDQSREVTPIGTQGKPASAQGQIWNLKRIRRKLTRLGRSRVARGVWADYTSTCGYSAASEAAKVEAVRRFLDARRPANVLDLGCNTGQYTELAHARGADVVAVDSDVECVDALYCATRAAQSPILPLCVDVANPSPAVGFRNVERLCFLDRMSPDCVFALALIHHLHVSANLPIADISEMFAELTARYLVLEFVPEDDPMFRKLMRFRRELNGEYTLKNCMRAFGERFKLIDRVDLPESTRTLLFWEKKHGAPFGREMGESGK
jgi:SAM-dependent methyltransferase